MKVTKIAQQQKRSDRYSIYLDDKYSFSLSEYQLVGSGLRLGKDYSRQEIDGLIDESQFGKMYERSLNYVMIRLRSQKEMVDYLNRSYLYPKPKRYQTKDGDYKTKKIVVDKEKTTALINRVIERLGQKGYIDDEAFAKAWVRSKVEVKKSSTKKIQYELVQKGVSSNIIETALLAAEASEVENLKAFIVKKRKQSKYQDDIKLTQYLIRQGFRYDDIKRELHEDSQ